MILIKHRINKISELKRVNKNYGVEIDIRTRGKHLVLHHEPFGHKTPFTKRINIA